MYAGLMWTLLVAVVGIASAYGAHRLTAVSATTLISLPFQSGWVPEEHALSRYHVRWYLATLVFLAFDVEMLFMYPWAVVVVKMGATAVIEMFLFLAALLVAVLWAWREGALRWT
ncbi:NADH-quinone oxidoreductase subunit A [Mycolicibacterium rhodesiae]|uniref:NADH-quinone oxidoreductase subunit n=1 Tax=Mycolicibacterium rhodesiae TaxID=36814 RepID=A0A1X0IUB3_MYCRH|nr:NADH-quinone oxidoreductase subunit A [Mycolicibacterium rhodesiae]MCV7346026.1 NADH-quinone oxidoreductase subunit A [Mycolicibacterium rhodesiae]ORB52323.1 NADH-quinone oxidoreductase subunit I [Mycolicibacterium rhodesiae]